MRKLNQFVKQVENAENIILYNFYNGKSIKYSKDNFPTTESFIANDDIYELLKSEEFLLENFHLLFTAIRHKSLFSMKMPFRTSILRPRRKQN